MPIELGNTPLTIGELVQISRFGERVELHPDAIERIKKCRTMLEGIEDGVAFELYWAEFNHDDIIRKTVGGSV